MTTRGCVICGLPEQRTKDAKGRELVNLDPVSGKCVRCLVHQIATTRPMADNEPFDAKAAAARNDT